jgi:hypothetical protein
MDNEGRQRAAAAVRVLANGKDAVEIADLAGIPDAATVRDFLMGLSWPRAKTRQKIEDAIDGLERGDLALYAYGDKKLLQAADVDPVVAAIKESALTAANKRRLELAYLDLLDGQGEVNVG